MTQTAERSRSTRATEAGSRPPRPMTRRRISPGKAYNSYIKGRYKYIGTVDAPVCGSHVGLLAAHPWVSHAKVKYSSWIKATTFFSHHETLPDVLIVWTEKSIDLDPVVKGLCHSDVPSYEVGRLHGFATIEEVREMTSEELCELLKRSLK